VQFWCIFGVGFAGFMMYKCWFSAVVLVLFFVGFMLYKCWFYATVLVLVWCCFDTVFAAVKVLFYVLFGA